MSTKHTILLVEDNADDEQLTIRALERANVANDLFVVRDGAEALAYLFCTERYSERDPDDAPQVVLLDLRLPKVSGLEVLRAVRANPRTRAQPIVVLTSSDMERDIEEAYELGANSFVTKPVRFQDFTEAVRQVGLYWVLLNKPTKPKLDSA
jgi:two-component system response regulator